MRATLLGLAALVAACGDPQCRTVSDDLMPLQVGNYWEYEETGGPLPGTIAKTVADTEQYAGDATFVWETVQTNSPVVKRANWHDDGTRVVRLQQVRLDSSGMQLSRSVYEPGFLRIDRSLDEVGMELTEGHVRLEYDALDRLMRSVSKNYHWRVEATDESLTVPAGTFTCVRIRRTDVDGGDVKTYWYARGVGKVKETDPLETEALSEVDLGP